MGQATDTGRIKQMLSAGHLSVADPDTGYLRSLYACCPGDGNDAPAHRVDRSRESITRVIFRCPACGGQFDVPADKMFLR